MNLAQEFSHLIEQMVSEEVERQLAELRSTAAPPLSRSRDERSSSKRAAAPRHYGSHKPGLLSSADASEHLGIAIQTLANWRSAGVGPAFTRLGRLVKYRVEDLERFVAPQAE